jgi:hypothetical protein
VTRGLHHYEPAAWYVAMHVLAHGTGSDHIVGALQDQRRRIDGAEILSIVREERHPGEVRRDLGVGAAEAVRQLLTEIRTIRIP